MSEGCRGGIEDQGNICIIMNFKVENVLRV